MVGLGRSGLAPWWRWASAHWSESCGCNLQRPDGRLIEFKMGQRGRGQRGQQGSAVHRPTQQKKNKKQSAVDSRSPQLLRISAGLVPPLCSHWLPSWPWSDLVQSHPPIRTIFLNQDTESGLAVDNASNLKHHGYHVFSQSAF